MVTAGSMTARSILETVLSCVPETPFPTPTSYRFLETGYRGYNVGTRSSPAISSSTSVDGEDRLSSLPNDILLNIVSRLCLKDAGRTELLSKRWCGLWSHNSLILQDYDLEKLGLRSEWKDAALVEKISRFLESYKGRFEWLHLNFDFVEHHGAVVNWMNLSAKKEISNLVLVHIPTTIMLSPLPMSIFSCSSLRCLYLGLWQFPDTSSLPHGPSVFPRLVELGLCHTGMQDRDLQYMLDCSPQLKVISFVECQSCPLQVCIRSNSLHIAVFWHSTAQELAVVAATHLRQLILESRRDEPTDTINIMIGEATELSVLGYLETARHVLKIGNIVIMPGLNNVCAVVPSVKVLALKVRFAVAHEVKTLISFLRCFPCVETLHVKMVPSARYPSEVDDEISSVLWQDVGRLECVVSHMKKVVFDQTNLEGNELKFIETVVGKAQMLQEMVAVLPAWTSTKLPGATDKIAQQRADGNFASYGAELRVVQGDHVYKDSSLSYRQATDLFGIDPFPVSRGRTVFWSPGLGRSNLQWINSRKNG